MHITVAHVITKLELGGAQQNTLFTVAHLNRTRFRPILITGEPGILDEEAKIIEGVEFHQVPWLVRPLDPLSDVLALISLTKLLRRLRPSIVHTHSSKAGILGRVAAWLAGVPVVIHSIHGFGFTPGQSRVLKGFLVTVERWVASLTTQFFVVSEANRRLGVSLDIFKPECSIVIRSGVDLEAIRQVSVDVDAKRRALGIDPGIPLVGMIGPLKPQKSPQDFVRVAAIVYQVLPTVRFLLVGDGELRGVVEHSVEQLGLKHVVWLLGWRRDIPEILRCLNVFVLTSLWEGLPRVYLEALSSGVPVVGTRVDGAEEIVRDGINGYLVEPGDVQALADRVVYLLSHPEVAANMGKQGQAIPHEFDIHVMVRRQEQEYDALLQRMNGQKPLREGSPCDTSTHS